MGWNAREKEASEEEAEGEREKNRPKVESRTLYYRTAQTHLCSGAVRDTGQCATFPISIHVTRA